MSNGKKFVAPVRSFFHSTRKNTVKVGNALSVNDLRVAAGACNYLLGRGNELIPTFHFDIPSGSSMPDVGGTTDYTVLLQIAPGDTALDRYWAFQFYSDGNGLVEISVSGSEQHGVQSYPINMGTTLNLYREPADALATNQSGFQEERIVFRVSSSNGGGIIPSSWSCVEAPRKFMNPLSESQAGGVDEDSFRVGYPVFDSGGGQYQSISGLGRSVKLAQKQVRRAGLFAWATPLQQSGNEFDTFALVATNSSYQEMLKFPILAQPSYVGVTSASVELMWVGRTNSQNIGGTIKFESSIDSVEHSISGIPGTELQTWYSASLFVPVVDTLNDRGLPGGVLPYITMSMKVDNGLNPPNDIFKVWSVQALAL